MKHQYLIFTSILAIFTLQMPPAVAQGRRGGPGKGSMDRREDGTLKEGQKAPDFNLKKVDTKKKGKLSTFRGKKPVVLIFGSYT
ncbi:MAG: hypothetical protein P1V97_38640 [Planctomycetota bacterium]|nr:hypothetical protein [Planctomycetota bacterium]